ncbi:TrkH family potassium uptake protein [Aureibacillus halotolerans]|uniref:Trk-type K+ transport system membrane component n=1 Tax=Aureibacillus halotolerans TaxID=1508390 RepID=A0A4R6TSF1_9BACI|nr:TrkH family potassium uptake protein [Aureibacillus halotolerans]TDQ35427.1 Trk-type K+ transport system membrane component [Aureibacillus halotolerans]
MLRRKIRQRQNSASFTTFQLIVLFYFAAVAVATLLLSMPWIRQPGVPYHFLDTMFTAVSAVSVTGLTVESAAETYNTYGYFTLAFIFQFGGIGIMTLGTFVWLILGKRIGLKERKLIMADQNQSNLSGLVQLMKQILFLILCIEIIGGFILSIHYLQYYPTWELASMHGFFSAISATTNAGFDISGSSLKPYANDYFVQFIHMILITLGAIGFPVLIEVKNFLSQRSEEPFRFSLFTKLTVVTFFSLTALGALLIFVLELGHSFAALNWHQSFFHALFSSVSTRSGGMYTMDINALSEPSLLVMSILMFIGASPSSVGGGIRTTSLAIILLALWFYARGKENIKVFRREIHFEDVTRSFVVVTTGIFLCVTSILIMSVVEPFSVIPILFEVCSAFGTAGLSLGITPELTPISKVLLMLLMFIGRIGIFSFLFLLRGDLRKDSYRYPKEKVIIG